MDQKMELQDLTSKYCLPSQVIKMIENVNFATKVTWDDSKKPIASHQQVTT